MAFLSDSQLPKDLVLNILQQLPVRHKRMCSMLNHKMLRMVDDNDEALFAHELIVYDASISWKIRLFPPQHSRRETHLGYVDLFQWNYLQFKMTMSVGSAYLGKRIKMPSDVCWSIRPIDWWTITKIECVGAGSCDWGASQRIDFEITADAGQIHARPASKPFLSRLRHGDGLLHASQPIKIIIRNFTQPKNITGLRTLSVLWSSPLLSFCTPQLEQDNLCLCCKFRKAVNFCPNDCWEDERKTCNVCCAQLMKSPLMLASKFCVSSRDLRWLRYKAGRVYTSRSHYSGSQPLYRVMIRVRDVELHFQQTWHEFLATAWKRRKAMRAEQADS